MNIAVNSTANSTLNSAVNSAVNSMVNSTVNSTGNSTVNSVVNSTVNRELAETDQSAVVFCSLSDIRYSSDVRYVLSRVRYEMSDIRNTI